MITLSIPNISCGHCARAIKAAVLELDPAAVVEIDIDARTAAIDTTADAARLRERLAAEGYPVAGP
ncbi:MAG TPA: heavy-metal-associated domain-containing protein [Telluria sp.]|nr:heavy-metal-associated domain-containing protein [Telluria sp.]